MSTDADNADASEIRVLRSLLDAKDREIAELRAAVEPWVDEQGLTWTVPTAWAYAQACKTLNGRYDRVRALIVERDAARAAVSAMLRIMRAVATAGMGPIAHFPGDGGGPNPESWSCQICGEEWETRSDDADAHHEGCVMRQVLAALATDPSSPANEHSSTEKQP